MNKPFNNFGPIKEIMTPIIIPSNGGEIMIMLSLTSNYRLSKFTEEVLCEISRVDQNDKNIIQLSKNQINTTITINSNHRNKEEMISNLQENTNMFLPVFSIYGAVNTYDINFNTESINFGSVVRGSQLSRRLVLMNTGDYNTKFEWDKSTFTSDLTIEPMNGSIGPGLEVTFILTLKPSKLTREIRIDFHRPHQSFSYLAVLNEHTSFEMINSFSKCTVYRDHGTEKTDDGDIKLRMLYVQTLFMCSLPIMNKEGSNTNLI
ncbi:unnamed protein product [Schistosoma curassoni]|nr:unnamed protein product [Schistosoma curassoni]